MAGIIYQIMALILGYGLIIGGFIIFGDSLNDNIKILDIIVSCLIFTQGAQITLFPMIRMDKSAHKEVGMMGIHYTFTTIYCIIAVLIMLLGAYNHWSFKIQLMCQLALVFILLIGRVATLSSGKKVEEIHHKELSLKQGKKQLADTMALFMEDVACCKELDKSIVNRINEINDNIRFISPSNDPIAQNIEQRFCQCIESISVMLRNTSINAPQIEEEVEKLERLFLQRKKY